MDGGATDLPPAEGGPFPRAQLPPRPGDERVVRVRGPYRSDGSGALWALFEPALAAINGFDEYPEQLNRLTMVAYTPVDILARSDRYAWLRIRVEDAIAVAEAAHRFPPSSAGSLGYLLPGGGTSPTLTLAAAGGLSYHAWSAEGDIGSWAVCTRSDGGMALVLYGEWAFHQDDVALGHRPLSPSETAAVAAAWPSPGPGPR